ncbi:outer membrane biogenesis protein BamB [Pirellulimonas nuda]|uniref:Outer membrane biogenesis protein BamB n=1 Tax=Pirellulimonas nuda TaxID=2528009 RepID=A0A518DF52_9BACT|nr:PQQ-binding-like beta-propeller repeat protein [Pirellulimonas nuda]QDU90090.1 outer membrane biogenesis protein BamB [Pirellulimonas nuda]
MNRSALLLLAIVSTQLGADWPQFRGPDGQGVAQGPAPLRWSEDSQNIRWAVDVPGRGFSSPVVIGDQVWLTTALETAGSKEEAVRRGKGGVKNEMEIASKLSLRALCYDRASGELLHDVELFDTTEIDPIHLLNSYASPTPVAEPGRVYCWFGTYGVAAIDTSTGEVLWRKRLPLDHYVGPGSSPVLWKDRLILTCDGADQQYVAALDTATGEIAWKTDRPPIREQNPDQRKSYCTPLIVDVRGRPQAIIPGAQWLVAYDPASGEELWRLDHGRGFSIVPRPVLWNDLVMCGTGFGQTEVIGVRLDGHGDVSDTHIVWRSKRQAPTQPSPVVAAGKLFTVNDQGIGVCYADGKETPLWQKRLGGAYSASPLAVGSRVYFFNRDGLTTVLDADSQSSEPIAENQLPGPLMATPALVDGELLIRTGGKLYAIGE